MPYTFSACWPLNFKLLDRIEVYVFRTVVQKIVCYLTTLSVAEIMLRLW